MAQAHIGILAKGDNLVAQVEEGKQAKNAPKKNKSGSVIQLAMPW